MFCRNCGSKVEDGARFCPVCGESVVAEYEASAESQGDHQPAPAAKAQPTMPAPAKGKCSKRPLVIAAVVAALLVVGGGAGYYFGIYAPEQAREVAEREALAAKHAVRFSVSAQDWDTSAGASRLPVHITGKEERGKKVDAVRYVDSSGEGVELRRGSYKVEIAASPIAADGTVYAVPAEKLSIKLGEKAAEKKIVDAGDVALEPVEASEVTDDQIATAKKYAEEDEDAKEAGFDIDAEALSTAATKRRDDAVAAKQAEEEARRQAEEEARKTEEAKRVRTIETDYFTMVLPDWFPIDQFTVQTTDHADQGDGMGAYTMVLVTAKDSFLSKREKQPKLMSKLRHLC
ncbi:MAG: zinc-ribbon domain-containing protein [Collinsella sp.]